MPSTFIEFAVIGVVAWVVGAALAMRRVRLPEVSPAQGDAIFYLAALAYCIMLATLSILRHDSLHSHAFDLGIFDQILWNSSRGHIMESSLIWDKATFFGNHISPTLLLFVPAYWVVSDPRVLLTGQAALLTLGAFPIYWYAKQTLGNRTLALVIGLSYFAYPATIFVNLFDFHEFALALPFISFAIYFMLTRRFVPFTICALLILATKEDLGILVSMLGLRVLVVERRWIVGAPFAVCGVLWTVLAISRIIPANNPSGTYVFQDLYAYLGGSQREILHNVLTHPIGTLQIMLMQPKLEYVLRLLTPLGFVALGGVSLWPMAIPTLGYLLLSGDPGRYSITTQYTAPLVPVFFFAAVEGCRRLAGSHRHAAWYGGLASVLALSAVLSYQLHGPGPLSRNFDASQYQLTEHGRVGLQLVNEIPRDAGVIAQTDLAPQLADRRVLYMFPWTAGLARVDYVFLDRKGNKYPLNDPEDVYFRAVDEMVANPDFETIRDVDGYLLLRRTTRVAPRWEPHASFSGVVTLVGVDLPGTPTQDGPLPVTLYWQVDEKPKLDYTLFLQLFDSDGRKVAQLDTQPTGQLYTTSNWQPGSTLRGRYAIALPPGLERGEYALELGLYDLNTMNRLPIVDARGTTTDTRVRLEGIKLPE